MFVYVPLAALALYLQCGSFHLRSFYLFKEQGCEKIVINLVRDKYDFVAFLKLLGLIVIAQIKSNEMHQRVELQRGISFSPHFTSPPTAF